MPATPATLEIGMKATGKPALKGEHVCGFDHDGVCYASTCYSSLPCTTRDENGQPRKYGAPKT